MGISNLKSRPVAIYAVLDCDGLTRYVGKTVTPVGRSWAHRTERTWFAAFFILEWTTHECYRQRERDWIKTFKAMGFSLDNKNNGGGGTHSGVKRKSLSQETKDKIGAANSLAKKGKPQTPEVIAARAKGMIGHKVSAEARVRMSIAASNRSLEACMNISRAKMGHTVSESTRQKMREAKLGKSFISSERRSLIMKAAMRRKYNRQYPWER